MEPSIKSERGQATLEALVVASFLLGLVSVLLALLYLMWFQSHLRMISHEYLVCQQTLGQSTCKKDFSKRLLAIHRFGKMQVPKEHRSANRADLEIQFHFGKIQWLFKDSILLPLKNR
jgi:hypothetical protein